MLPQNGNHPKKIIKKQNIISNLKHLSEEAEAAMGDCNTRVCLPAET